MEEQKRPRVGVALIVRNNGRILLHKRKNKFAFGTWACPGGKLEFGEGFEECALRELGEEAGDMTVRGLEFVTSTNDIFTNENEHYITIFMRSDYVSGNPEVMEPEKCEKWEWHEWGNLPQPLMLPIVNLIKQGYSPFER
jgi:8-oxo-dGTP diphosphatase